MGTDTLYRKVGNRYVEAGMYSTVDLYPGVWIVQKFKGSTRMQSLCVSELPSIASLVEVVQATFIAEIIMERLKPMWEANELIINNRSFYELERIVADAIIDYLNDGREEAINRGYKDSEFKGVTLARETMAELTDPTSKNTWHGVKMSKIDILLSEISEIGHRKVGTHEFSWFMHELKVLFKKSGLDLKETSIGGFIVNPDKE